MTKLIALLSDVIVWKDKDLITLSCHPDFIKTIKSFIHHDSIDISVIALSKLGKLLIRVYQLLSFQYENVEDIEIFANDGQASCYFEALSDIHRSREDILDFVQEELNYVCQLTLSFEYTGAIPGKTENISNSDQKKLINAAYEVVLFLFELSSAQGRKLRDFQAALSAETDHGLDRWRYHHQSTVYFSKIALKTLLQQVLTNLFSNDTILHSNPNFAFLKSVSTANPCSFISLLIAKAVATIDTQSNWIYLQITKLLLYVIVDNILNEEDNGDGKVGSSYIRYFLEFPQPSAGGSESLCKDSNAFPIYFNETLCYYIEKVLFNALANHNHLSTTQKIELLKDIFAFTSYSNISTHFREEVNHLYRSLVSVTPLIFSFFLLSVIC